MKLLLATAALALTAGTAPLLAQSAPAEATSGFSTSLPLEVEAVNERAAAILTRIQEANGAGNAD